MAADRGAGDARRAGRVTIDIGRWNRMAASTVVLVVAITVLNLFWTNSDRLLLDTIVIATLSSLADEAIRLLTSPAAPPGSRKQALAFGLVVALGWAVALYLTRNSPERMSWILGGTVGLIGVGVVAALLRAWRRRRAR